MSATSSISIGSLDASDSQPEASPAAIAVKEESAIPCAEVTSDFEAIYRLRCAEVLARAQPAVAPLKSATPWIPGEHPIRFTVPPNAPDNSAAPGYRLRQKIKVLENAEDCETIEFTAYPYVLELLSVVAGTGDLPAGYDAWLALFTAVYLALPKEFVDRICEDLLWALGGDREAFHDVFNVKVEKEDASRLDYFSIAFNGDTPADIPNRQYVMIALNALREYLNRIVSTVNSTETVKSFKFTFYELSVRFLISGECAEGCECPKSSNQKKFFPSVPSSNKSDCRYYMYTAHFSNSNPRMLHHVLTSPDMTVMNNGWPNRGLGSNADAAIFAEILCAYNNSKLSWHSGHVFEYATGLLFDFAALEQNFEFVNILLSNLVASGIEFEFDATYLLASAARRSEETYLAWCSFVKRAEVFAKLPPVTKRELKMSMVELQCTLLEHDLFHHAKDGELQQFMLSDLDQLVSCGKDGNTISSVGELICNMFNRGKIAAIRHMHRLGLDIEFLRKHLETIEIETIESDYIGGEFSRSLEFADEQGWLRSGGAEYRNTIVRQLLTGQGAFDAVKWLYGKYPETGEVVWRFFNEYTRSPYANQQARSRITKNSRRVLERYSRGVRWILRENREVWRNQVDEGMVLQAIRMRDHQRLHLLYTVSGVKPRREHAQAALSLIIRRRESVWRATHAMYLMLLCIRNAFRANGVQLNLLQFLETIGDTISTTVLSWMMRRGFFAATKPKKVKKKGVVRATSSE
jgi:hypothetical protein